MTIVPKEYGEVRPSTSIDGAEFLEEQVTNEEEKKSAEDGKLFFIVSVHRLT